MRLLGVTAAIVACASAVLAQDAAAAAPQVPFLTQEHEATIAQAGEKHAYQSDIARLLKIVVGSLYSDKDVWVRELLSNSNDALEKLRLMSLTDPSILDSAPQLNVSVIADKQHNRIIIRDSGIGMSKEQLTENLGTIARSGTTEFLEKLEKGDGGNLIGQFGLGFYSSFLVADRVTVASKSNDSPQQYIFESEADAQGFSIVEDPRGNTLGRGTEITLWLKDDAREYLENEKLKALIERDAEYGASPIFLWTETKSLEPVERTVSDDDNDDEVKVEDDDETKAPEMEEVTKAEWKLVNDRAPLWMREPKEVSDEEYENFYKATFKSTAAPLAWTHFKGDAGSTSFRALVYLPDTLPNDFYSKDYIGLESLKLFVRRVFITGDLGKDYLPKHLNWVKVFVDVDDLPLNVGRDRLQKTRALGQIKSNLSKRILDLFAQVADKDSEKYNALYQKAGTALKVGIVEDVKNRERILKLLRFETTASSSNLTSLSEVVSRRKTGQTQLFYLAGAGMKKEDLERSPYIERILARGYECIYFMDPMDEMLVSSVPTFEGLRFQDVAKEGLTFGDEDEDAEEEAQLKTQFEPLAKYLQKQLAESVDKVIISTRLTNSPCVVTVAKHGHSANMERLIAAQNQGSGENFMAAWAKMQKKTFEINPKHPLIEALLERVEDADVEDSVEASSLKESAEVLWNTALVKSGFQLADPNGYFSQIETILRRSLGVSQSAKAQVEVRPAPPVETGPVRATPEEDAPPVVPNMADFAEWADLKDKFADATAAVGSDVADEADVKHDEL